MSVPSIKRITIATELELRTWLVKHPRQTESVMLVTNTNGTNDLTVEHIQSVLTEYSWVSGNRYTLNSNGNMIGHVISPPRGSL